MQRRRARDLPVLTLLLVVAVPAGCQLFGPPRRENGSQPPSLQPTVIQ